MKITLIYPLLSKSRSLIDENKQYWPPLGLAYLAAVLENKGHEVQILDRDLILRKCKLNFEETDKITLNLINKFCSNLVGFSATTPNISDVNSFSKIIKEHNPKIAVMVGGPHCTGVPEETLKLCPAIDIVARGEGELAMLDAANGVNIKDILGITYKDNAGIIVSNHERPLIENLDDLPFPARHLLDMNSYTRPSRFISRNLALRTTHVFTTRGCPYNCSYCAGPLMGRRRVRYHSAQRVLLEIVELINKYSIEGIYFADDMFLSNKKRAMEIIELFIRHKINKRIVWMAQLNPNAVDMEFLLLMKKAGCVHVEYGFESGSARVLELMNKKTNINHNLEVARITKKSGLRFQGNFIVGYPGETEEDFNKTIWFIRKSRPNNVSLNLFMPLPGTEIYKKLVSENRLVPNWDDFGNPEAPYINYADMQKTRFEELYFKAKLRVILPINLMHFLKDNIWHPFRLFYVIFTQFKSVLTKAGHARKALEIIKGQKKTNKDDLRVLIVIYHSISFPIMESQVLSYARNLSSKGVKYSLLTFEAKETLASFRAQKSLLNGAFKCRSLPYHQKPRSLMTLFDILCGIFTIWFIIKKDGIKIIHARGLIPAIMAFIPSKVSGIKFFFDTRGLLADKYVGGGLLRKNSLLYKIMRISENFLIKSSDAFTVETNKHAEILKNSGCKTEDKMEVIPCCVDLDKFNYLSHLNRSFYNASRFNLIYVGKMGTWYLLDEMLDFFKILCGEIKNATFTFITQDEQKNIYLAAEKKGIPEVNIAIRKLSAEQIPVALASADAGIFFINPYERYNSSPIKYGEYLSSGLPVIINAGIGDTESITKQERVGVVIEQFTDKAYGTAIKELAVLLEDRDGLRKRCRDTAAKFLSLDIGISKYLTIYQKLLNR